MLIGILSDSHGRSDTTALAVAALIERGADLLLHLGDVGSQAVLDELIGHSTRIVLGNCDWPEEPLRAYAELVGIAVDHPAGMLDIDDCRIAFTHGHLAQPMQDALEQEVDYLLHGHTHEFRDERLGRTRVINPGALFRAARYTAALLDPVLDRLEVIEIPKSC